MMGAPHELVCRVGTTPCSSTRSPGSVVAVSGALHWSWPVENSPLFTLGAFKGGNEAGTEPILPGTVVQYRIEFHRGTRDRNHATLLL